MQEFRFLKNRSGRTQQVVYKGQHLQIAAREEEAFPAEIAKAFLDQCHGDVVEVTASLGARA